MIIFQGIFSQVDILMDICNWINLLKPENYLTKKSEEISFPGEMASVFPSNLSSVKYYPESFQILVLN